MQYELLAKPAATVVRLTLDAQESFTCEVGAMVAMSNGFHVETSGRRKGGSGGLMKGLKRMFAGENYFLNHFTATAAGQTLYLGPSLLGDIVYHPLRGGSMIVQGSSWLASSTSIELDATWQGWGASFFSGESIFWVKCSGTGHMFLSSFGAIYSVEVDGEYVVDSGHIVAFEDTLQFKIGKSNSSWIGTFAGGEGLVCRFSGKGRLYCQSHNPPSFGKLLGPTLKPR